MKKLIAIILISAGMVVLSGCSKRNNPVEPTIQSGTTWTGFIRSTVLDTSATLTDEPSGRYLYVYVPPGYVANETTYIRIDSTWQDTIWVVDSVLVTEVTNHDYPVIYLLHGYGGNYQYYHLIFNLAATLNEMISTGEIVPMIVVIPDCSNSFGGSFYANSPVDTLPDSREVSFSGKFEDFLIEELMPYVKQNFAIDTLASQTGISGHSMGGYGAYRLAMRHPELFGSVSAMSAPMYFAGFPALLPAVFAENGFTPGDTASFYAIAPSARKRVTSMMFAMGAAFSPHKIADSDTTLFHRVRNVPIFFGVDLPFRIDGSVDSTLWATKWLPNDPFTMLTALGGAAALSGKKLYLDCGADDDLYLHLHNQAFSAALTQLGLDHVYYEYAGYPGMDAGHIGFVADRLREVFKFHSQAFAAE